MTPIRAMASYLRRPIAIATCLACMLVSACGSPSPAAPTAPAASVAAVPASSVSLSGVWRGYMSVVECASGVCGTEQRIGFVLRAAAGGPGFIGSFESPLGGWTGFVVDVSGVPQADGAVLFTGTRGPVPGDSATYDVTRLSVRIDQSAGLTGEVELHYSHPAVATRSFTGRIVSASYLSDVAMPGASFSGTWSGLFVIRACAGYCPAYMTTGSTERFELSLGHSGTAVTGQIQMANFYCSSCWLPVSGTATGPELALRSDVITRDPVGGIGDKTMFLESFTGGMDALGRLSGRLVYSSTTRNYATPADVSYRIEGEILWCTRSWPALR
ncbi:MAG TPA: hypothetical protein VF147_18735 [Vicinamibacterales bacterium]